VPPSFVHPSFSLPRFQPFPPSEGEGFLSAPPSPYGLIPIGNLFFLSCSHLLCHKAYKLTQGGVSRDFFWPNFVLFSQADCSRALARNIRRDFTLFHPIIWLFIRGQRSRSRSSVFTQIGAPATFPYMAFNPPQRLPTPPARFFWPFRSSPLLRVRASPPPFIPFMPTP